jgi:hypothetical protein
MELKELSPNNASLFPTDYLDGTGGGDLAGRITGLDVGET